METGSLNNSDALCDDAHPPPHPVAGARTSSAKGVVLTRLYYHAAGAGFMQYDGVIYGRIFACLEEWWWRTVADSAALFWQTGVGD